MSKILDVSFISDTSELPIKAGTLQFLQDAHKETAADILTAMIGPSYSSGTAYVLYGCTNSGSGSAFNIAAGAIFLYGNVYRFNASSFTAASGQTAILSLVTTQYTTNADPVTMIGDGATQNVHNITNGSAISGTAGGWNIPYSDFVFLNTHGVWVDVASGSFSTGWTSSLSPNEVKIQKNGWGRVQLNGIVNNSGYSVGTNDTILTLPSGYSPSRTIVVPCYNYAGAWSGGQNTNPVVFVQITSAGVMRLVGYDTPAGGYPVNVYLDSISFPTN
jgi:hypothetical protein